MGDRLSWNVEDSENVLLIRLWLIMRCYRLSSKLRGVLYCDDVNCKRRSCSYDSCATVVWNAGSVEDIQ